ncbi:AQP4 protein, partial [Polypterus senegalus]
MVAFKGIWTQSFWRSVSGEFLAMLIFVLLSLGSTINWGEKSNPPPADLVLISLCFGLSIATLVQCFGHISGAHINPAVTAALVCTKKLSLAKAVFYIIAQCLGAIAGAGILYLVTPEGVRGNLGVTTINSKLSIGHGLVVEMFITFELVFTVFATCDSKRQDLKGSAALAIGFAVTIGHLFAVYWVGPLMGAIIAAALYDYLFCPDPDMKRRLKQVLSKSSFPSGRYMEVEDNKSQVDVEDLMIKPGSIHVIDVDRDEKKEKDPTSEVLSSV